MDSSEDSRKQIIFTLDNVRLDGIEKGRSKTIYKDIERFLMANGFEHTAGYVCKEPVKLAEVIAVVGALKNAFPVLNDVVVDMNVTEVWNTYYNFSNKS